MIDINDLKAIEKYFSDNLSTPLFPILGDLYFKKGDYKRSKKVCQIGLKKNPNSSVGYYILSKISLIDEDLKQAEKYLEKSINYNSTNLSAKNLLFFVHRELNRSKVKIKKNVLNILSLDPNNYDSNEWLNKNYKIESSNINKQSKRNKNTPLEEKTIQKSNNEDVKQESKEKEEIEIINTVNKNIEINNELASMTLFNIYKSQGYYNQALQVLNVLKTKNKKDKKIDEEITILKNLINESK